MSKSLMACKVSALKEVGGSDISPKDFPYALVDAVVLDHLRWITRMGRANKDWMEYVAGIWHTRKITIEESVARLVDKGLLIRDAWSGTVILK